MEKVDIKDEAIIKEILDGNINSYSKLIQKYNQRLYRLCKGYLTDEAEIEDIMQDAYIKAFINLRQFAGRSSFSTWISQILINESLQRINKINKNKEYVLDNQYTKSINFSDNINPETTSMNNELRNIIEKNLESLPENYRIVFLMREIEKMNVAETAEVLTISEANVKVRLNRAKELLRKSILKSYPMEELYNFNLVRCSRIANNVMKRITEKDILQNTIAN